MNDNSKKTNAIVLTVIAIATMIVVVIGATFAYLASGIETGGSANINAVTNGTSDLLIFNVGDDIEVYADEENFGIDDYDISEQISSSVTLTSSNPDASYTYNVALDTSANNFEYTSGTCYNYMGSVSEALGYSSYEECQANGNIWAKTADNSTYTCYQKPSNYQTISKDSYGNNALTCLSQPKTIWALDKVAELTLTLYKGEVLSSGSCETYKNGGVCIDKYSNITGVTDEDSCNTSDGDTWVANYEDNGVCYTVEVAKDLTTIEQETQLPLLNNEIIKIGEGATATNKFYLTNVILHNLDHNQIENGVKAYNGSLLFSVVKD